MPRCRSYRDGAGICCYELIFKCSITGYYATIEKKTDVFVPFVLWRISAADERRFDTYEGFSRFYYKKEVVVETDDGIIGGLMYIMHENCRFGIPEYWYYQNMERDYRKFGFDLSILRAVLRHIPQDERDAGAINRHGCWTAPAKGN